MKNLKGDNALNFLFLLDQKLKTIQSTSCTEMRAQTMCEKIIECIDNFAPEKEVVIKNETNSWITNEIKKAMVKRDCLFRKWVENPKSKNHIEYKNQRNVVTQKIRLAKKEANFKKLGPNPSPKHIYRTLKAKKLQQMQHHCTVLPDLDHLNNYFVSVGQILSSKLPTTENNAKIANNKETMFVYPTDEFEVAKILKNMKNKKSTDEDGISNEMLKCCSPIIEPHIATLFNNCIEDGIFPDCFKTAKVIPLYKKGDRKDPGNYKPISL